MLKKSCAILISIALAMGVLVHGSFAFSVGPDTDIESLVYSIPLHHNAPDLHSQCLDYISTYGADNEGYMYLFCCQVLYSGGGPAGLYCFISTGMIYNAGNRFIYSTSNDPIYFCVFSDSVLSLGTGTLTYDNHTLIEGGITFYRYRYPVDYSSIPNSVWYANYSIESNGVPLLSLSNLDADGYVYNPDTRVMEVFKSEQYYDYTPYLGVRVDDMPYAYMWISVRYTDRYGDATKIFDIYDLDYLPGDDFQLYLIDPFFISSDEFTVTSVVFSGSLDWGYKEVDGLDIVFNEPFYPDPIPSVTPVPDYNYFDTDIINYNGGQKDIFYNSFQVNIKRFEDSTPSYFFVDDYGYLNQPFSFNFILLPYYPVQQGFLYDEFIEDCFYQYDVILSEYYDAFFDFFYGSGALNSLQTVLSSYSAGADISSALENWYSSHSPVVYTYPYFDDSDLFHLSSDMPALLVVTDSFYFKQTNYLLGDTGNILSQFSERFYKVGGFSDTLFGNLLSSYNLDLAFYQNTSRALTGLSYWLNDNSLYNLGYLVNIDTDLHELLEWFQNQEDPDVVLALPYFNPSLLEELYGLNIGELIQFFNGFVQTLPSFDYSDFPNFFDYADDVVADIVGAGDSIVDVILDPYEYDDSGLSTFGWD